MGLWHWAIHVLKSVVFLESQQKKGQVRRDAESRGDYAWTQSWLTSEPSWKRSRRESHVITACLLLWEKKYKGSTQHVPRSMDQNKQCIVDAWKQHSSNMFTPQIRDPRGRQEWNKCEGQEFELAQREPFFFAHKCHAGATESIQWGTARDMQNQSLSQETLVLGAGKEGSSQWANCAAFLSGLKS